jgi:hypothetical protein
MVVKLQDTYPILSSSGPLQPQLGWHWLVVFATTVLELRDRGGRGEEMFGGDNPISPSWSAAKTEKEKSHG